MSEFKNSELLDRILSLAEEIRIDNDCSEITRDHIVLAAIQIIQDKEKYRQFELTEEYQQINKLLAKLSKAPETINKVLDIWRGKKGLEAEKTALSLQKWKAEKAAQKAGQPSLMANFLLEIIIKEGTLGIQFLLGKAPAVNTSSKKIQRTSEKTEEEEIVPSDTNEVSQPVTNKPSSIVEIIQKSKSLQSLLQEKVLGQPHAVSMFAAGFFQAQLQSVIEKERAKPKATFLFAGPPGVGKTFLSEEAAKVLKLPYLSLWKMRFCTTDKCRGHIHRNTIDIEGGSFVSFELGAKLNNS